MKELLFFLCGYLLQINIAFANDHTVANYKKDNSSIPNVITGLFFGADGLLYIATQAGVFTYNGNNFFELKFNKKLKTREGLKFSEWNGVQRTAGFAVSNKKLVCLAEVDFFYKPLSLFPTGIGESIPYTVDLGIDYKTANLVELPRSIRTIGIWRSDGPDILPERVIKTRDNHLYWPSPKGWMFYNGKRIVNAFTNAFTKNLLVFGDTVIVYDDEKIYPRLFEKGRPLKSDHFRLVYKGKPINFKSAFQFFYSLGRPYLVTKKALYKVIKKGSELELVQLFSFPFLGENTVKAVEVTKNEKTVFIATNEHGLFVVKSSDFTFYSTRHNNTGSSINGLIIDKQFVYANNGTLINLKSKAISKQNVYVGYSRDYVEDNGKILFPEYYYTAKKPPSIYEIDITHKRKVTTKKINDSEYAKLHKQFFINHGIDAQFITSQFLSKFYEFTQEIKNAQPRWSAAFNGKIYFDCGNLYVWDSVSKSINPITSLLRESISFIKLLPNAKGIIVGTYGGGLYYSSNGSLFKAVFFQNYPEFKYTHNVFFDSRNRVWLVTNQGILCTGLSSFIQQLASAKPDCYFASFNISNGVFLSELNSGGLHASFKVADGNYFFSGLEGFSVSKLDSIQIQLPTDTIGIVQTVIDGVVYEGFKRPENEFFKLDLYLHRPAFFNSFPLFYEYRVLPIEKDWNKLGKANIVRLPGLAKYNEIKVQFRIRTGLRNEDVFIQEYSIQRNVDVKYIFIHFILPLIGLAVLIWLIIHIRLRILKRRNNELESVIANRTAELEKINSDLKVKSSQVKFLSSILVHDIKSPLKFISIINKELIKGWVNSSDEEKLKLATDMDKSVGKLLQYVTEFLSWLHLQWSESPINFKKVDVSNTLDSIASFYRTYQERYNNNRILVDSGVQIHAYTDASLMEILFRNLIDNALKNTKDGVVLLKLIEHENHIEFICEDNGKGMTKDKVKRLLSLRQTSGEFNEDSFSMGYFFINFLADKLNIKINIDSDLGSGTRVTLTILKL